MADRFPTAVPYVLATSTEGTKMALHEAGTWADGQRVVLLIPITPDMPRGAHVNALLDCYTKLIAQTGVQATAYACVCRRIEELGLWFPLADSMVVVGGNRPVAVRLEQSGYHVVHVPIPLAEDAASPPDVA